MRDQDLPEYIMKEYDLIQSWRVLAREKYPGVKFANLRRYAFGDPVLENDDREILGLARRELVDVCSCGEAHTYDCSEKKAIPVRKTTPKKRVSYPTLKIRKDDMESASSSIVNRLDPKDVEELLELIERKINK